MIVPIGRPQKKLELMKSMANCLSKTRTHFRSHAAGAVVLGFHLGLEGNIEDHHHIQDHVARILSQPEISFFHKTLVCISRMLETP
jgi:hypothetical protein